MTRSLSARPESLSQINRDRLGRVDGAQRGVPDVIHPMTFTPRQAAVARDLGRKLRHLRKLAGYSTRSLAERMGISAAHFSNWELGRRLVPRARLDAMLDVLQPRDDVRAQLQQQWEQIAYPFDEADGEGWPVGLWRELTEYQQQVVRQVMKAMVQPEGGTETD
jgi:transcriptional regulator with XRE-family HTH domain